MGNFGENMFLVISKNNERVRDGHKVRLDNKSSLFSPQFSPPTFFSNFFILLGF